MHTSGVDANSVDTNNVDTNSVDTNSVDTNSMDTNSVDTKLFRPEKTVVKRTANNAKRLARKLNRTALSADQNELPQNCTAKL